MAKRKFYEVLDKLENVRPRLKIKRVERTYTYKNKKKPHHAPMVRKYLCEKTIEVNGFCCRVLTPTTGETTWRESVRETCDFLLFYCNEGDLYTVPVAKAPRRLAIPKNLVNPLHQYKNAKGYVLLRHSRAHKRVA